MHACTHARRRRQTAAAAPAGRALQDQVPPFEHETALAILQHELGRPPQQLLGALPSEPVASASLGQVYRCALAGSGREVAVKVQRPGVRRLISLDIHVLRLLLGAARRLVGIKQDVRLLADELGRGLQQELDYRQARGAPGSCAASGSCAALLAGARSLLRLPGRLARRLCTHTPLAPTTPPGPAAAP
jgi:hypothetical protein